MQAWPCCCCGGGEDVEFAVSNVGKVGILEVQDVLGVLDNTRGVRGDGELAAPITSCGWGDW